MENVDLKTVCSEVRGWGPGKGRRETVISENYLHEHAKAKIEVRS